MRAVPGDGADFDRAAKELEPRARFAKVNVDEEPAIAARFGIRGIPTLIAFEKGKVAKQHAGLVDINSASAGALRAASPRPVIAGNAGFFEQLLLALFTGLRP